MEGVCSAGGGAPKSFLLARERARERALLAAREAALVGEELSTGGGVPPEGGGGKVMGSPGTEPSWATEIEVVRRDWRGRRAA